MTRYNARRHQDYVRHATDVLLEQAEYGDGNVFSRACFMLGIPVTRRQAKKFVNRKGLAYKNRLLGVR